MSKLGPKLRGHYGTTGRLTYELTPEMRDLMERRTRPFMDGVGLQTRSISDLLQEAYLQGLTDAVDAMNERQVRDAEAQR